MKIPTYTFTPGESMILFVLQIRDAEPPFYVEYPGFPPELVETRFQQRAIIKWLTEPERPNN